MNRLCEIRLKNDVKSKNAPNISAPKNEVGIKTRQKHLSPSLENNPSLQIKMAKEGRTTRKSNRKVTSSESDKLNTEIEQFEEKESVMCPRRTKSGKTIKHKISSDTDEEVSFKRKPIMTNHYDNLCISELTDTRVCNIHGRNKINKVKTRRPQHKMFWESNLTGARRVSKRLTNMKMKKNTLTGTDIALVKYMFTGSLQKTSNQKRKPRAQKPVVKFNVTHNTLKKIGRTNVSNTLSTKQQSKAPSNYCKMIQKLQTKSTPLRPTKVNDQPHFKQDLVVTDIQEMEVSNICSEEENSEVCTNNFYKTDCTEQMISSNGTVEDSSSEEISSSTVSQQEVDDKLVHLDLEIEDGADKLLNNENSGSALNKQENILDVMQKDCEANSEIIIVEINTFNSITSNMKENCDDLSSSDQAEVESQKENGKKDQTNVMKPNNEVLIDENVEQNVIYCSESKLDIEETANIYTEAVMDLTSVEDTKIQGDVEQLKHVVSN